MPDKDKESQTERNRKTLITARLPVGLKPRTEAAAKAAGLALGSYVATALEEKLARDQQQAAAGTVTIARADLEALLAAAALLKEWGDTAPASLRTHMDAVLTRYKVNVEVVSLFQPE